MKKNLRFILLALLCAVFDVSWAQTTSEAEESSYVPYEKYELVTDASTLKAGDRLVIVGRWHSSAMVVGDLRGSTGGIYGTPYVSFTDDETALFRNLYTNQITLKGEAGAWKLGNWSYSYPGLGTLNNHNYGVIYDVNGDGDLSIINNEDVSGALCDITNDENNEGAVYVRFTKNNRYLGYDQDMEAFVTVDEDSKDDMCVRLYRYNPNAQNEEVTIPLTSARTGTVYYSDKNLVVPANMVCVSAYVAYYDKDDLTWLSNAVRLILTGQARDDVRDNALGWLKTATAGQTENTDYEGMYLPGEVIPAGVPVIMFLGGGSEVLNEFVYPSDNGVPVPAVFAVADNADQYEAPENCMLYGTDEEAMTEAPDESEDYSFYRLTKRESDELPVFRLGAPKGVAFMNGAHKAYLAVPKSMAEGINQFGFDGSTDGIESLEAVESVENGVYTVSGVRVNGTPIQKGLYIVNGKKMVVK